MKRRRLSQKKPHPKLGGASPYLALFNSFFLGNRAWQAIVHAPFSFDSRLYQKVRVSLFQLARNPRGEWCL